MRCAPPRGPPPRVLAAAEAAARAELIPTPPGVHLDYFVITDPALASCRPSRPRGTDARALVAAKVGSTRLIDNLPLVLGH